MRRNEKVGDNSNGNDDNINGKYTAHKDYKYCIVCWCSEGGIYEDGEIVEFYQEGVKGRQWQHTQRCSRCEDLYVHEFIKAYPNTKPTGYKFNKLTDEEVKKIKRQQEIRKGNEDE